MADKIFRGDAVAVAQINTVTPANVNIGNTFSVTINGKTITFTATVATVANVTAGLYALLYASTIPEFVEVIWTDQTTHVKGVARTAGKPFTQTSSATGGTATNTTATTTSSAGPNHWDTASNWSPSGVPTTGDAVYLINSNVDLLWGLNQTTLTYLSMTVDKTYVGKLGLLDWNTGGYYEYRPKFLVAGITTMNMGSGDAGSNSPRFKWDGEGVLTTINVFSTGTQEIDGVPPFLFKGTNASNVLNMTQGHMGVAFYPGEVATILTARIGSKDSPASDVTLILGAGVTGPTTLTQTGGTVSTNATVTTWTINTGTANVWAGAVTTLTIDAGKVNYNSTGTIGTLTVGSGGDIDFSRDIRARAITNTILLYEKAGFWDPHGTISGTPAFQMVRGNFDELARFSVGTNKTLTRS